MPQTNTIEITGGSAGNGEEVKFKKFKPTIHLTDGKKGEAIMVVAANFHNPTKGNKMMFFAHAVRTIRNEFLNGGEPTEQCVDINKTTLIYFKQGYNDAEIAAVKKSVKNYNVEFIPISTFQEIIDYINKPMYYEVKKKENGKEKIRKYKREIRLIHFYSHGKPSKIPFAYEMDGENANIDGPQTLSVDNVENIKPDNFSPNATIYSFACRTANVSYEDDFTPRYSLKWKETEVHYVGKEGTEKQTLISRSLSFDTKEERSEYIKENGFLGNDYSISQLTADDAHPENSLAQKLADHLNITVYAYISRTNYGGTFNDHGNKEIQKEYIDIPDKSVEKGGYGLKLWQKHALWHPKGAVNPVIGGDTPKGLDYKMHAFLPKKQCLQGTE